MARKLKVPQFDYIYPPEECEIVYHVLGGKPGLDPCGHPEQFLEAGKVKYGMSEDDDGFMCHWAEEYGSVFLNAPHGEREPKWKELVAQYKDYTPPDWRWRPFSKWMTKTASEAQKGATVFAFLPAATDRKWFHLYMSEATSFVLLERRIKCYVPNSEGYGLPPVRGPQPMNAHMLALWTKDKDTSERFYEAYHTRGMVVEPRPL